MNPIKINYPSGSIMITLNEGTKDEKDFCVKGLEIGCKPYCNAFGGRYYLTPEEIQCCVDCMKLFICMKGLRL